MAYTDRDEIPTDKLSEEWGVPPSDIGGLMNAARSGKKLYNTLREEGVAAKEFPSWWYKPAIAEVPPDPNQLAPALNR